MKPLKEQGPQFVTLLCRKLELKKLKEELHLLRIGSTDIIEEGYDNWNGGQYYYTLYIDIPIELFVEIEDKLDAIEKRILKEVVSLRRGEGNEHITAVTIRSAPDSSPLSPHLADTSGAIASPAFWETDHFRIFISHVATYKKQARELKIALKTFGVTSFVAHEDIEPTKKWLDEIQSALSSMDSIVAIVTPDFIQSKWCDQEVGIAMGLGRLIVPVRMGADPYGFLGKYQGLASHGKTMDQVASEVFSIIAIHDMTRLKLTSALVKQIYSSRSFAVSKRLTGLLARLPAITSDHARRLRQAVTDNSQVNESFGVPAHIESLLRKHGHKKPT